MARERRHSARVLREVQQLPPLLSPSSPDGGGDHGRADGAGCIAAARVLVGWAPGLLVRVVPRAYAERMPLSAALRPGPNSDSGGGGGGEARSPSAAAGARIAADVGRALVFLHARGLVHGAVCPAHVRVPAALLEPGCDGRSSAGAVLCDFGDTCVAGGVLAPRADAEPAGMAYAAPELLALYAGAHAGAGAADAPELHRLEASGRLSHDDGPPRAAPAQDVFAAGVLVFALVHGEAPWTSAGAAGYGRFVRAGCDADTAAETTRHNFAGNISNARGPAGVAVASAGAAAAARGRALQAAGACGADAARWARHGAALDALLAACLAADPARRPAAGAMCGLRAADLELGP
jgi:hypothetical protein